MTASAPARRPPLRALTGIRFIAAAMVLLFHFGAGFAARVGAPRPAVTFLGNGYLGVSLFFMLSGFIIAYTYEGKLSGRAALASYAAARFSRIYPVYLLALLLMLPFARSNLTAGGATRVLLMVQSWTAPSSAGGYTWLMQAWTLSVELFFYLCAPLLLAGLHRAGPRTLAAAAVVLALALPVLQVPGTPPDTVPRFEWLAFVPLPALRLIEFAYGAVLCTLFLRGEERVERIAGDAPVLVNAAAIVALIAATPDKTVTGAAMTLTGLLLVQLAAGRSLLARLLSGRAILLLGASSYALYLLQAPVREYLRLLPSATLAELLNPLVAVAASVLVFRWWEEPARRFLHDRLAARRRAADIRYGSA